MANKSEYVSPLEIPAGIVFVSYLLNTIASFVVLGVLVWLGGHLIKVDIWQYVGFNAAGLVTVPTLIVFGWAAIWAIIGGRSYSYESKATLTGRAIWVSLNAGFWEEIRYRGIAFLGAMVLIPFLNWLLFGFAGANIVFWVYQTVTIPVANFVTLGLLAPWLLTTPWIIGAAMASAASQFSDAHEHLGWFGKINAWFLGMFFFWIMFNYGMITAMVIHAIYDIILLVARALKSEQAGWSWLR